MDPSPAVNFNAVLVRIRAFAAARNWRPARLAREAGLSDMTTRGMGHDDWAPSGSTVRALEKLIPEGWAAGDPAPEDALRPADPAATATASEGQVG